MVVVSYKSGLRLNRHPLPEMTIARAIPSISSGGIRIGSGKNEIILDPKRLDRIQERQQLEAMVRSVDEIAPQILRALRDKRGFSVIRLGDAEILTLAQDTVFPTRVNVPVWGDLMAELCHDPALGKGDNNEVVRWRDMMYMSGIHYPDLDARDLLAQAVKTADVVGIPVKNRPGRSRAHLKILEGFQTVLLEIFKTLNLNYSNMKLADSALHYLLFSSGWLHKILFPGDHPEICQKYSFAPGYKPEVLLVGNRAGELEDVMVSHGIRISGVVKPVDMGNVNETMTAISNHSFDIALIAAGVAAKILCSSTATRMNRVAIDAGHLFDLLIDDYSHLKYQIARIPFEWML
jgi:hypothetical protein